MWWYTTFFFFLFFFSTDIFNNRMRKVTDSKEQLSLFDELNLSRHGLISIQKRIGKDWVSWSDSYVDEDREISVSCKSTPDYGVPHGLDTDFVIGVQNLFVWQGCPPSNRIRATAYQILRASGLDTSGRYYGALRESLMRLSHSTYTVQRGWFSAGEWLTETFRHFQNVRFISSIRDGLSADSIIEVELSNQIALSLRSGHLKPLNGDVLRDLGQHSARALFRLLDGLRHNPAQPDLKLDRFSCNLVVWGRRCRMADLAPDRIRRTLEKPHEDLLRTGYLRDVRYDGRGSAQTVTYTFSSDTEVTNPDLAARLHKHKVIPKIVASLIEAHGNDLVAQRLSEAEQVLTTGAKIRSPAAFIVSYIRNPEDYRSRLGQQGHPGVTTSAQPKLLEVSTVDVAEQEAWEAMTPSERARSVRNVLKVALGDRLTAREYEMLTDALSVEALAPDLTKRSTLAAIREVGADQAASSLRAVLASIDRGEPTELSDIV
ncbi:replication initiator protein A [Deinococcus pimensis]|uniref:replication initiator protein A n=1 Tax=Deinococcus pimensis TaxID=309888 RepID=UPI00146FB120|nr:replication initiator protein A [Deinococcus pimensis]